MSSAAALKAVPSVLRSDATVTEFLQPIRGACSMTAASTSCA